MANDYGNFAPKTKAYIRGKLEFGRLITPYDGEELIANNKRRVGIGKKEINSPHRSIRLRNAALCWEKGTPLEQYLKENKLYNSEKPERKPNNPYFELDPKGALMPLFYELKGDRYEEFVPENELDSNLDVTIEVEVFQSRNGSGLGLRAIYVNEPVRYFTRNNDLEAFGVTIKPMSREQREAEREALINRINAENAAMQQNMAPQAAPAQTYGQPVMPQAQPYQPPYQGYQQPPVPPYQGYQQPTAPQMPMGQANGFQQPPVNPAGAGISWGEDE